MTYPGEPLGNYKPARRANHSDKTAPKKGAVPEPETELIWMPQRTDDPEAFIETRVIPRIQVSTSDDTVAATAPGDSSPKEDQPAQQPDDASLIDQIDQQDRKNLGRNSLLMASGTLVSRLLGMVNASLQTAVLGTAVAGSAFKSANTLPNFILVLLSAGILNAVLIPQITKAMKRPDGGKDFVDRLLTIAFVLIAAVAVSCTAGAAWIMQTFTSLSGTGLQLAIAFAYICMPQVLFYGIFAVLGNLLNARGSFGPYGWAPVANNLVAISGLVVFLAMWGKQEDAASWTPEMIWVLAGTATLGIAVQAAILIPPLYRLGFRWTPRWGLRGHGFGHLGRFASLTFLALVIAQGGGLLIMKVTTYLADEAHLRGTEVGNYMHYQNALNLFQMPYSLFAVSLLTALFPQLARAWQRRDDPAVGLGDMQMLVRRGLTLPALGIIPAAAVMIALAGPAVRVVYASLGPQQAQATALPLMVMCASMLAYTIVTLQQQYCFATEQGVTNLWMQCLVTGIQVGFTLLAYLVPLEYGLIVVCLGMFVGNTALAIVFVLYARHQIGSIGLGSVFLLYLKLGSASAMAGLAAWVTAHLVLTFSPAEPPHADAPVPRMLVWAWQFGAGIGGGMVFLAVLLVGAKLLRIGEFFDLLNPVLRRLRLPQL